MFSPSSAIIKMELCFLFFFVCVILETNNLVPCMEYNCFPKNFGTKVLDLSIALQFVKKGTVTFTMLVKHSSLATGEEYSSS